MKYIIALSQVRTSGSIRSVMGQPPNERLAKVAARLDQVTKILDELHFELVELMREQGVTWDDIGEVYDPPKSRQAMTQWARVRRARKR